MMIRQGLQEVQGLQTTQEILLLQTGDTSHLLVVLPTGVQVEVATAAHQGQVEETMILHQGAQEAQTVDILHQEVPAAA